MKKGDKVNWKWGRGEGEGRVIENLKNRLRLRSKEPK